MNIEVNSCGNKYLIKADNVVWGDGLTLELNKRVVARFTSYDSWVKRSDDYLKQTKQYIDTLPDEPS